MFEEYYLSESRIYFDYADDSDFYLWNLLIFPIFDAIIV